jgi:hypothetical protein
MMKEKKNFILTKSSKEPSSPCSSTFLHYYSYSYSYSKESRRKRKKEEGT